MPAPVPPEAVLDLLTPGADVIVPLANGEPTAVMDAIEAGADGLKGVRVHQMHALHDRPYLHGAHGDRLTHVSYFLSHVTRPAYWDGTIDLVPNNFSEVPLLLQRCTDCTVVVAAASPPDRHGYFSLGTNADYVTSLIGRVPFFLEATPHMPRTHGANTLHHSQVVGWCESDRPLLEVPRAEARTADRAIGELVAERIPDGATIQIGIGSIAAAVLDALRGHRDLGVHTELLHDGVVDLVEAGVVTGVEKEVRRNRIAATFCLGTKRLYDWLDGNAVVEMLGVDFVNDPRVIARMKRFASVNATTEVDLIGQCASETVAGRYWSSSGGQADFARGAMYAEEGQAFIVTPSLTRDGRSRIVPTLTEGSVVTTLKNTVDHVVTEHGVAELRGRSLAERARALIAIADPSVRDDLTRGAVEKGFLR
ncbi:acetyl-CoA hydrolase/transferase family protein [Iamia sp. SCSIO 61187]|uniref:acetyl-CoA hydrolase/transferase family protein n=1 Tax=Iamia sp. SCSIO 61187 TaxID=2722752 RepID=UPI001C629130|nr:acetyl-CoA hydrolase/transferase C-terminal domain-containing protein [Iamia sp. SCSIO 61187]QYG91940.1 acetyl-CoA hydrolase/transferase family protein [Iamia sp. SCSIO 61187]